MYSLETIKILFEQNFNNKHKNDLIPVLNIVNFKKTEIYIYICVDVRIIITMINCQSFFCLQDFEPRVTQNNH